MLQRSWRRPQSCRLAAVRASPRPSSPSRRSGSRRWTPPRIGIVARSQRPAPTSTRVILAVLVRSRSSYVPGSRRTSVPRRSSFSATSRGKAAAWSARSSCGGRRSRRRTGSRRCASEIHLWLGAFARFTEGAAAGDRHAAAALELAKAVGDDSLRAWALSAVAFGRFRAGLPGGLSQVAQAVQLATSARDPRQRLDITFMAVNCFVWAYELDRARTMLAGHRP